MWLRATTQLGSPNLEPTLKRPVGVDAQASQLLKDDLDLAVELPHVQQEGVMVAVVSDDVVVHVDQDSERRRGDVCLEGEGLLPRQGL